MSRGYPPQWVTLTPADQYGDPVDQIDGTDSSGDDVVVVVVTYNSAAVIVDLLESIPAAMEGLSSTVVVVDNGSVDDTASIVASREDCTLIRSTNRGYSAGINLGAAGIPGSSAVLVLNPDVRLGPGSVRVMYSALSKPNVGIVVPRIIGEDGSLFRSLRRAPTLGTASGLGFTGLAMFNEYVLDEKAYESAGPVDWALGAVMLVSGPTFARLGGFDESFFLYSEETDFCLRARDRGLLTWFVPDAEAMHIGAQSGTSDQTHVMQIVNRVRLYRRRNSRTKAWVYWLLTLLSEISWIVRGHRQSRAAVRSLVRPSARPQALNASHSILPT